MSRPDRPWPRYHVVLTVDGEERPLRNFIHEAFGGAVLGLVRALKDCEDAEVVELRIRPADVKASDGGA